MIKSQTKIRLTCLTTHPPQEKLEDWGGTREKVQLGSTEIWTRIAGFRVQSANHYTIEPSLITGRIVTYSNEFPFTVKLQMFVRYPFSYFWLETGSHARTNFRTFNGLRTRSLVAWSPAGLLWKTKAPKLLSDWTSASISEKVNISWGQRSIDAINPASPASASIYIYWWVDRSTCLASRISTQKESFPGSEFKPASIWTCWMLIDRQMQSAFMPELHRWISKLTARHLHHHALDIFWSPW